MVRNFRLPVVLLAAGLMFVVSPAASARTFTGGRVAHSASLTSTVLPDTATSTGWLGSRSASVAQNAVADIAVPSSFTGANLLVALVGSDGPDTFPATSITTPTTAVFGGTANVTWTRVAHVSARHDWATPGAHLELYGASVAEVWTATPPQGWSASGDITVTTTHPNTRDDGMTVTIVAYSSAQFDHAVTFDGLAGMPERRSVDVPNDSSIYAATFAGRVNADFTPTANFHDVVERQAGDDTATIISSNSRDLPTGSYDTGMVAPDPGNFWEVAVAVVTAVP